MIMMRRKLIAAGLIAAGLIALAFTAGTAAAEQAVVGDYVIQLASVKSQEAAEGEWLRLRRANPTLLDDMTLSVQSVELKDRGIFFRIQTGPFPNQATAQDMCWQLRAARLDCLVVKR